MRTCRLLVCISSIHRGNDLSTIRKVYKLILTALVHPRKADLPITRSPIEHWNCWDTDTWDFVDQTDCDIYTDDYIVHKAFDLINKYLDVTANAVEDSIHKSGQLFPGSADILEHTRDESGHVIHSATDNAGDYIKYACYDAWEPTDDGTDTDGQSTCQNHYSLPNFWNDLRYDIEYFGHHFHNRSNQLEYRCHNTCYERDKRGADSQISRGPSLQ